MDDDWCADTAEIIGDVVMEVALNRPHVTSEAWHDLRCQAAFASSLHFDKVSSFEAWLGVPHVDVWLAFVAQENARFVVGPEKNDLKSLWLWTNVNHGTGTTTLAKVFSFDREKSGGLEVGEVEVFAARLLDEQDVQDIRVPLTRRNCSR